ncbi:MAG: butyryl-CoA:acetate CoA-transferase [Oscillospiraceae bacterium]|nr:butyryl-CoA:acetate CoA-transferase [Oscillospiraceae bacterium]
MKYAQEYRDKLCTAAEAVRLVHSGDWVDYGGNNGFPIALDAALAERRDELYGVKVRGNLMPGPLQICECDPELSHFVYHTWHCSSYERRLCDQGRAFFIPMVFRHENWYYEQFLSVNVAMMTVSPMDEDGWFSLAGAMGSERFILDKAEHIILEVNEAMPYICGGPEVKVHVSEADRIVEVGNRPLWSMPLPAPSETDRRIAAHILPHLCDGATLQLGIGGMPNALGELIADSDLKDLGMHTELCSDGYLALSKAGKLTNRRKTLLPGKGVLGLAIGSKEMYDWLDHNDDVVGLPLSYVNDPAVIAQNDNMISINGCLHADLYGQVGAESTGTRQISGTGGQLDFVEGAIRSHGGKAFLCMSSTFTGKDGVARSRILPSLAGDIVTTPRSLACYIVTEYGAVNLAGLSTWQRADALISIAHPDHREELIRNAQEQRIWLPHNKR